MKNGRPGLDLIFVGSPGKVSLEEDSSESIEAESHKWQCCTSSTDVSVYRLSDYPIKNLKDFRSEPRSTE